MKKSKFLKKSLAMLLALMLVVAMIPLSAAAASEPALSYLYVDDVSIANNDGTFESSVYRYGDGKVELRVAEDALHYSSNGTTATATLQVVKDSSSTGETISSPSCTSVPVASWLVPGSMVALPPAA